MCHCLCILIFVIRLKCIKSLSDTSETNGWLDCGFSCFSASFGIGLVCGVQRSKQTQCPFQADGYQIASPKRKTKTHQLGTAPVSNRWRRWWYLPDAISATKWHFLLNRITFDPPTRLYACAGVASIQFVAISCAAGTSRCLFLFFASRRNSGLLPPLIARIILKKKAIKWKLMNFHCVPISS